MLLEVLYQCSNGRGFLTDSYINTIYRLTSLIETLLIDNGVYCYGSLTRLTVTDDKLTLTTTNRNHGVDSLQTCLQRFLYWLSINHTRSLAVQRHLERVGKINISQSVNGLTQRVNDTS